jgi:hypothetical protein
MRSNVFIYLFIYLLFSQKNISIHCDHPKTDVVLNGDRFFELQKKEKKSPK